jgi:hypothetical protein
MADFDGTSFHHRPDVIEVQRAIGGFITAFSEVVVSMRRGIESFLLPAGQEWMPGNAIPEILLAQMTADPIRAAFFAISNEVADLNDADRAVQRALQNLVQHYISLRNDIAHADWSVGWEDVETGEWVNPFARKVKITKAGLRTSRVPFDANDLHREVGHLYQLRRLLDVWGEVCRRRQVGNLDQCPSDLMNVFRTREAVGTAVGFKNEEAPEGGFVYGGP